MTRKRWNWYLLLGVLYLGLIGAGTCGNKAKDQIGKAKAAVEEARQAEAPQYAASEFKSAEESLDSAQQQFGTRKYKKAQETAATAEAQARDARDKALAARKQAEDDAAAARRRQEEEETARLQGSSLFGQTVTEPSEEEQARMALHDLHFAFDSFELSDNARSVLALNLEWLKQHPGVKIEIEGHTDEQGTEEYNLALGSRRAKIISDYLVENGIDPARMRTISYGESVPIDSALNEDAYAKNRRVHFAVMQ